MVCVYTWCITGGVILTLCGMYIHLVYYWCYSDPMWYVYTPGGAILTLCGMYNTPGVLLVVLF